MIKILAVAGCLLWWSGLVHASPITVIDNDKSILTNIVAHDDDRLDLNEFKGLDRADQVAGEHGERGRNIAELHHQTFSGQTFSGQNNVSFTTQEVGLSRSTIHGAIVDSPTTAPNGDPPLAIPEVASLLLLTSGLVGLWFMRVRKCQSRSSPTKT